MKWGQDKITQDMKASQDKLTQEMKKELKGISNTQDTTIEILQEDFLQWKLE